MKNAVFFSFYFGMVSNEYWYTQLFLVQNTTNLSETIYEVDYSYGRGILLNPDLAPFKCLDGMVFYSVTERYCRILGAWEE